MSGIRETSEKLLVVGLGNPGRKYEGTRHNVGFLVIDELARRYGVTVNNKERKSLTAHARIKDRNVILAKPQTYMNLSGEAVRSLMDFYKIPLDNFIVIHDDIDLPLGTLRIRMSGGHGGQNGMRNIIMHMGTRQFDRIRFGVNRPPGKMDPVKFVLMPFTGDDLQIANEVVGRAADAVEVWIGDGMDYAMSQFNGETASEPPPPKKSPAEELEIYQRAHELNPDDPKPVEKLIPLLRRLGKMDEVAQYHLLLANLYYEKGLSKKAISNWEQATRTKPELVDIHLQIASAYLDAGNNKKAVARYLILAEYYLQNDQQEKAEEILTLALEVNPQHPLVLEKVKSLTEPS